MCQILHKLTSISFVTSYSTIRIPVPEVRAIYRRSLHLPVSTTYRIPGIVIEVSATLVANIHLREFGGVEAKILACCCGGNEAYMGQITTLECLI